MSAGKIDEALKVVRQKLSTGGTVFGHDLELFEAALLVAESLTMHKANGAVAKRTKGKGG